MVERDLSKKLSIIVPAWNEEETIGEVLKELLRLQPDELIVVDNGSEDQTGNIAGEAGARVITYDVPLGNDIPRAIGALATEADIYLFTDSDIIIPAEELITLIEDIEEGVDMAINAVDWCARFPNPDAPSIARYYLNVCLGRRDLGLENVLTIPHAFSKKALDLIGREVLANPLLATAMVIDQGLNVSVPTQFNVLGKNRPRKAHQIRPGDKLPYSYLRIHGDTNEAFRYLLEQKGPRFGLGSGLRDRKAYRKISKYKRHWQVNPSPGFNDDTTLVLSISQNSITLRRFLESVKDQFRLIPIVHGADERVRKLLTQMGIHYVDIHHFVGHDVAFAIGAELVETPICVFHDTMLPLDNYELFGFIMPIRTNQADITINNQSSRVGRLEGMSPVHIGNYYMNVVGNQPELTASAMNLPPYAMNQTALEKLGTRILMNPWVAQLKALDQNLRMVEGIFIDSPERLNAKFKRVLMDENTLLGDQMEALYYWIQKYGYRGNFHDGNRQRQVLPDSAMFPILPPITSDVDETTLLG